MTDRRVPISAIIPGWQCLTNLQGTLEERETCSPKPTEIIVYVDAAEHIEIGKGTMIGPHCYITDHDHGTSLTESLADPELVTEAVHIGRDVWIGAGVKILKGVQVGDQSILAAGAVVTKSVPERAIVAGVPARVIQTRE